MEILSRFSEKPRVQILFPEKGRTKGSMQKECDINNIMAKYQKTGAITHFSRHSGEYGFADSVSFHGAMNIVTQANEMFNELPSSLRSRFGNDAGA